MVLAPPDVAMAVHEGQRDPLRGWYCEAYSKGYTPAPQIVYCYPSRPAFYAVLAMPLGGRRAQPPVVSPIAAGTGRGFTFTWADGEVDVVALSQSLCVPLDDDSPFATDSPLVWQRLDRHGQPARQFLLDGTYAHYRGHQPLPTSAGGPA
jgi:hypothetical protein